jgi:hypothetical protein
MKLRQFLARHMTALRLMLLAGSLVLVLNSIAYLAHDHAVNQGSSTAAEVELCGYCPAFGGLAAAPAPLVLRRTPLTAIATPLLHTTILMPRRVLTAAQARAPPTH